MQHLKVTLTITSPDECDVLIALLAEAGYDGFEDDNGQLYAYIGQAVFNEEELMGIAAQRGAAYTTEVIAEQNWNALWESNFEPVIVDGFCTIRAHFHDIRVTTPYDIVITPKMSFGTGHHATTQLMMLWMKELDVKGKRVLDFGTGTGVLAILAEMLGAADILAIDNDEWSVTNTLENTERNKCDKITVMQGSLETAEDYAPELILANINRHILLQYMPMLYDKLAAGGTLLMSGLLTDDREIIMQAATDAGFKYKNIKEQANWIAMVFGK